MLREFLGLPNPDKGEAKIGEKYLLNAPKGFTIGFLVESISHAGRPEGIATIYIPTGAKTSYDTATIDNSQNYVNDALFYDEKGVRKSAFLNFRNLRREGSRINIKGLIIKETAEDQFTS